MSNLALFGGTPVRVAPPEPRPRITESEAAELARSLAQTGDWSRAGDAWPSPYLDRLEACWAELHGGSHAVAISSGTAALTLTLQALCLPAGDEVLIPAYGCPAVDLAVLAAGLTPVHVDLDPRTYAMSPVATAAAVTARTAAMVVVHWGGQPAHRDAYRRIAERNGLALVEDACLAPGARYADEPIGRWGNAAVFSLGVRKPVSAGEGGLVVTRDAALAERIRAARSLGADGETGEIRQATGNFRLTEWAAAVTLPQLSRLELDRERRTRAAAILQEGVAGIPFLAAAEMDPRAGAPAWAQFWLRYSEERADVPREAFVKAVQAEGTPLFAGWGRTNNTLGVYSREKAAEWLRARGSGREPDAYERAVFPSGEQAAYSEALLLDLPALDDEAAAKDAAEALRKVAAEMDTLRGYR